MGWDNASLLRSVDYLCTNVDDEWINNLHEADASPKLFRLASRKLGSVPPDPRLPSFGRVGIFLYLFSSRVLQATRPGYIVVI